MSLIERLKVFYLLHLSQPRSDRELFRLAITGGISSILEVGIRNGARAQRLVHLAAKTATAGQKLRFTAIDWFDERPREQTPLTLKDAYRLFQGSPARFQFLPGDPASVFSQNANRLGPFDLVILSAVIPAETLLKLWFYLPRMLKSDSIVFLEEKDAAGQMSMRRVPLAEINRLADQSLRKRRVA